MNTFKKFLSILPLPISGLMLAIASLGILFPQFFAGVFPCPEAGFVLYVVFGIVAAVLWMSLLLKLIFFPAQIRSALHDPILASVAGTFPMATMVLSVYLLDIIGDAAVYLWFAGVLLHAALIVWYTWQFVRRPALKNVFPSWLVVYAGIIISPITAPFFSQEFLGQGIWWFGVTAIVVLTPFLILRCCKMPLIDPAKPLVCIFAAPVSIALAGYVQCFAADMLVVSVLLMLETLVLALIVAKLPRLLRLPFFPSYAAFTFPFVVTATAYLFGILELVSAGVSEGLFVVAAAVMLLAVGLVVYVFGRYAVALKKMMIP